MMSDSFQIEEFLPFRLNVVAMVVSERLSALYGPPFDLDIPQWRILANLASRGETTAQEVAEVTFSHKSTISRAVQHLESRRLIERVVSEHDKRAFMLRLTAEGRRMFRNCCHSCVDFQTELLAQLSDPQSKALLKGLSALEKALLVARSDFL